MEYGIVGLLILILDVYAIIQVLGSGSSTGAKLLWVLGILIFPVVASLSGCWPVRKAQANSPDFFASRLNAPQAQP